MKKLMILFGGVTVLLIVGVILFVRASNSRLVAGNGNKAVIVDGKQIIEITAKGGYNPRLATAQAGIPTVLKIKTQGTFDCSSALSIPALDYKKNLAPSGVTDIEVPPQQAGTTLRGVCAMGMYNFAIKYN